MGPLFQFLSIAFFYMANYLRQLFHLAQGSIGSQPDIFDIDVEFNDALDYEFDDGFKIDLSSKEGINDTINHVLGLLVAPELNEKQIQLVTDYAQKLDAILMMAAFAPAIAD